MRAGTLRDRIRIDTFTTTTNSESEIDKTWVPFAGAAHGLPALIEDITGRELQAGDQRFAEATTHITVRYLPGVDETMRLFDPASGKYYDILGILDLENRHRSLEFICKTGLTDGG